MQQDWVQNLNKASLHKDLIVKSSFIRISPTQAFASSVGVSLFSLLHSYDRALSCDMSWQTYVDSNLMGTGKVVRAAILGQKGGVWAATAEYDISPEEQKAIVGAFTNVEAAQASGIRLAGKKFFTVQANERSIYGKKGADGCILVKTQQAVLVAEYAGPVQAAEVTPTVESLADYLISVQY